jgi:dinuclear metal center YbgI/SA1388 family protein
VKIRKILEKMDFLYPPEWAEEWDHIGLQAGDPEAATDRVLVCLDVDGPSVAEAVSRHCGLILSHHPLLFEPLFDIDESQPHGHLIAKIIREHIAVFSAHTNLDQAPDGVSFHLAKRLGLTPGQPLIPYVSTSSAAVPDGCGVGCLCSCLPAIGLFELVDRVILDLDSPGCHRNFEGARNVSRVAVFGGSFPGEYIPAIAALGTEALVAGEIRYHDQQALAALGISAIAVGHDCSERVVLRPLADRLASLFPDVLWEVYEGRSYHLPR